MANRHLARSVVLQTLFEWDTTHAEDGDAAAVLARNVEEFGGDSANKGHFEGTAVLFTNPATVCASPEARIIDATDGRLSDLRWYMRTITDPFLPTVPLADQAAAAAQLDQRAVKKRIRALLREGGYL